MPLPYLLMIKDIFSNPLRRPFSFLGFIFPFCIGVDCAIMGMQRSCAALLALPLTCGYPAIQTKVFSCCAVKVCVIVRHFVTRFLILPLPRRLRHPLPPRLGYGCRWWVGGRGWWVPPSLVYSSAVRV